MKFRKKPLVIEAVQFTRAMAEAYLLDKVAPPDGVVIVSGSCHPPTRKVHSYGAIVKTPEGNMAVTEGDWIITGIQGEHYPCKPDIFSATYEPVQ